MNKAELIDTIFRKTAYSKPQIEEILNAALSTIQSQVSEGNEVKIVGFGIFSCLHKKARIRRNPRNGVKVEVPETKVPKFRPGKEFRHSMS